MKKEDSIKISITLYGDIPEASVLWWNWFSFASEFSNSISPIMSPNYIAINSNKTFKSGKVSAIEKVKEKFSKAVSNNEIITSIELYSLKKNFKQAAFEYDTLMIRYKGMRASHITYTFSREDYERINTKELIEKSKSYINFSGGQIYEMSVLESPFFYASKANPVSCFKTLKVLEEF